MKIASIKPFIPSILWGGIILWLSISSGVNVQSSGIPFDKLGHFVAYGLLAWLFLHGLKTKRLLDSNWPIWTIILVAAYGIALEFVQGIFFPHRLMEVWDMVANTAGATISYLLFRFLILKT